MRPTKRELRGESQRERQRAKVLCRAYPRRPVRRVLVDVLARLLIDLFVLPLLPFHHQALLQRPNLLLHPLNALLLGTTRDEKYRQHSDDPVSRNDDPIYADRNPYQHHHHQQRRRRGKLEQPP